MPKWVSGQCQNSMECVLHKIIVKQDVAVAPKAGKSKKNQFMILRSLKMRCCHEIEEASTFTSEESLGKLNYLQLRGFRV